MKLFSGSNLFRYKNLFIFLLLFSSFFILFPNVVHAEEGLLSQVVSGVQNLVGGWAEDVAKGLIGAAMTLLTTISLALLKYGLDFLNWTASGDFIQGNMMTSMDNPVIAAGWGAMRNIANILLIFGLVVIAISIMVGYEENKAKKLLVKFVITALLINFTPVLCGVLIDIANIIMAAFLKGGISSKMASTLEEASKSTSLDDLGVVFVITIITFVSFFIYILYGLLFMVRYIWLWMLIVLSPVALATRVFPENEYIHYILPELCQWKEWRAAFLQWTFIGVPAAFSIYLSETMLAAIVANPTLVTSSPSGVLAGTSLVFSMIVPMAVLVTGFLMTVSKGGWAGSKIKGVWGGATSRIKNFAKDQTVDRAGRVYNRFTEGMAISRAETAEARARGEKVGLGQNLGRQLTGGTKTAYRQSVDSVKESITSRVPFTATEKDKEISDKVRADYVKEMKDWNDTQKDAVVSSNDMSLRAIAQRDNVIKERADKGKLKDAEVSAILAAPGKYSKDTREAVMKRMPHLTPQLSDEKDKKISTLANQVDREREQKEFDNIMVKDFMQKMSGAEKNKIQVDSAINHASVAINLEGKHIKNIMGTANNKKLKELKENEQKYNVAQVIINTGNVPANNNMGFTSVQAARDFVANEDEKTNLLYERARELRRIRTTISRANPNYAQDVTYKNAKEEMDRIAEVINERERQLKGIIL